MVLAEMAVVVLFAMIYLFMLTEDYYESIGWVFVMTFGVYFFGPIIVYVATGGIALNWLGRRLYRRI